MTTKTIDQLREDSSRMRTLGTSGAVIAIAGAAIAGLVSVPLAAAVGVGGVSVAAVSLLKKLSDDRAAAEQSGTNQRERAALSQ